MSYNKDIIFSVVKKYFSLDKESLELFEDRLYNPVIDDVYKSFGLDEEGRKYWRLENDVLESLDTSWHIFKRTYPTFVETYGVSYKDYRSNKIRIGKNYVKLKKSLVNFYLTHKETLDTSTNFMAGFGILDCVVECTKKDFNKLLIRYDKLRLFFNNHSIDDSGVEGIYRKFVDRFINSQLESISRTKMPAEDIYLVLSCNFEDWFFCSTGNGWSSCLSLESDYAYWSGLPGLVTDTNRAILYITTKEQKKPIRYIDENVKLDKMIARTWLTIINNNKINIARVYPSEYFSYKDLYNVTKNQAFKYNNYLSHNTKSKNSFELLFFKDGKSLCIYLDNACLAFEDHYKASYLFVCGGGLQFINKNFPNKEYYQSPVNNIDEGLISLIDSNEEVGDYLTNVEDMLECHECGSYFYEDEMTETSDGLFLCGNCFSDTFTYCADCGEIIRIDTSPLVDGEGFFCDYCFEKEFFTCERCFKTFCKDVKVQREGGKTICYSCANVEFLKNSSQKEAQDRAKRFVEFSTSFIHEITNQNSS